MVCFLFVRNSYETRGCIKSNKVTPLHCNVVVSILIILKSTLGIHELRRKRTLFLVIPRLHIFLSSLRTVCIHKGIFSNFNSVESLPQVLGMYKQALHLWPIYGTTFNTGLTVIAFLFDKLLERLTFYIHFISYLELYLPITHQFPYRSGLPQPRSRAKWPGLAYESRGRFSKGDRYSQNPTRMRFGLADYPNCAVCREVTN